MSREYLFVYGTLRRGSRNRFARRLAENARFIGEGRIRGRLYDFGRYPGAVRSEASGEWVGGEVFLLRNRGLLETVDRYEGPEFERSVVRVELTSGVEKECWVYFAKREPMTGRIAPGEWVRRA